jgi:hypothetical protein
MFNKKLIIRTTMIMNAAIKLDTQHILSGVTDDSSSSELIALRNAFNEHEKKTYYSGAKLVLDYPVSYDQLRANGGTIYHHELDCVISILPIEYAPQHPFSNSAKEANSIQSNLVHQDNKCFGYSVELIDSAKRYGDRYLNIGNKVYRVTTKTDGSRKDGIYVVSNNPVTGKFDVTDVKVNYFTFEEAQEKVGLFKTHEEALNLGDVSLAKKMEMAALEQTLLAMKHETQIAKQSHELEIIEKNKELKRLEMEASRHAQVMLEMKERVDIVSALERQRIKDHFEDTSHSRKEQTEIIKWIPAMIIGAGAICTAIASTFIKKAAK